MTHERLQGFVIIDYTKKMTIRQGKKKIIVGMGQYVIIEATHTADVARPLRNLKIGSRKRALEIFRGTLPPQLKRPQRRLFEREARVSSLQRSEGVQDRKMSSVRRDHDFQRSRCLHGPRRSPERGIGTELLCYLTYLAKRQGPLGFTAAVISDNEPMLHVFEKSGADIESAIDTGVLELRITFRG